VVQRLLKFPVVAIAWTILIQVLLCLPGSTLPSGGVFDFPQLDKIIHTILFGGFTGFWCYYCYLRRIPASSLKVLFFVIFLLGSINGIALEFIQRDYIPNRSFDQADIIIDLIACSLAYGICTIRLIRTTE
jgi:hypothetical protein